MSNNDNLNHITLAITDDELYELNAAIVARQSVIFVAQLKCDSYAKEVALKREFEVPLSSLKTKIKEALNHD